MSSSLRLMLVGRNRLFRECLVSLLDGAEAFRVVAQTEDLSEAAVRLDVEVVDVLLLDQGPLQESVRGEIRRLLRRHRETKILVIGVAHADEFVACIEAGAGGCVAKEASALELTRAIELVNQGKNSCSPAVTRSLFNRLAELALDAECQTMVQLLELTAREVEVLELLAQGLKNREIATRLSLSPHTVKNHVHNLLGKLDAADRVEAVREAFRRGWLLECRGSFERAWPASSLSVA